jgi:hypothetical protein
MPAAPLDLSAREQAEPESLGGAPEVAAIVPDPEPAPDRLALPSVPAGKAWDGLFQAADDLAFGTITQEGLVDLSFALLAQLPADAEPQLGYGFATYDLLESPGLGKVQLIVNLEPPTKPESGVIRPSAFTIKAQLETRPGAYTGLAEDQGQGTSMQISVGTDERDALQHVAAVSQNMLGPNPQLWSHMDGTKAVLPIGGTFNITGESSTWRVITLEAAGTAEEPGLMHRFGEPVGKPGKLAEPRTQLLSDVLTDRRRSVAR